MNPYVRWEKEMSLFLGTPEALSVKSPQSLKGCRQDQNIVKLKREQLGTPGKGWAWKQGGVALIIWALITWADSAGHL